MTIQTINLGNYANDGSGDDLRTAFTKVNNNFTFLNATAAIASGTNLGAGTGIFADKNGTNLEFKSLTSTGNSVVISNTSTTVDLEAVTKLSTDTSPTLGANLNLNGHYTYGGDTQTTVYGFNVPDNVVLNSLLIESNNLNVDMGGILTPTGYQTNFRGYTFDWGMFSDTPINNQLNFGTFTDHLTGGIGQLTLAGNLTTTGAYNLTFNTTANTSLTLPTSGTLTTTANNLSAFASTTSAQLGSVISDKTGSGYVVFSSSPVLTGTVSAGSISASGTINATGTISANGGLSVTGLLTATSPTFTTSVTTPSTTFSLYNTTATTINAFGAATTITVGASTGTTTVNNSLTVTGNTTLTTNTKVIGDFDNTTVNNRTVFTTVTANANPGIYAVPNGTATAASWQAANSSNLTNASKILIATNGSTDVQLVSGINGTGTYLPLSFYTNGSSQMQLSTAGVLTLQNSSGGLVVNGSITFGSATVAAAGTNQATATAITVDNNYVSSGTGGVVLPTAVAGREISITNNTASPINVYPAVGASIENSSANVATVLPAYATLGLAAKSSTNWWATQPVYSAGTGVSITQSANGTVTWTNTGVTSAVAGTGVSVSGATGAVTFSIGQAVATSSNVQFANITRSGLEITPANYITVSSTTTYALSTTITDNILLVTTTALTATLTFPASPVDGQRLRFSVQTNTVTLALTAGPTLSGTFAGSVTAPTTFTYIYRASNTTWYRIQ